MTWVTVLFLAFLHCWGKAHDPVAIFMMAIGLSIVDRVMRAMKLSTRIDGWCVLVASVMFTILA